MRRNCGKRDQVDPIVLQHGLERTRITAAQEAEEAVGNLQARHISYPIHLEQRPLERTQPASAIVGQRTPLPQAPSGVQRVEVRDTVERHLDPMEAPPCFHHRDVEGLAVVGNDELRPVEEARDRREERPLGGIAREQELAHLESTQVEVAAPDEKRHRASTAAETRGFEVDEDCPGSSRGQEVGRPGQESGDAERGIQDAKAMAILQLTVFNPHRAVKSISLVPPVDHQAVAEWRPHRDAAEDGADARQICWRLVSPNVGLVRELPYGLWWTTLDDGAQAGGKIH
jgi:hypothetical protein